jgi:hypothetical protein
MAGSRDPEPDSRGATAGARMADIFAEIANAPVAATKDRTAFRIGVSMSRSPPDQRGHGGGSARAGCPILSFGKVHNQDAAIRLSAPALVLAALQHRSRQMMKHQCAQHDVKERIRKKGALWPA